MNHGTRAYQRASIVLPIILGVIASAIGIAWGLYINWFPTQASTQAKKIDTLWDVLITASVPIFVGVTTTVLFCVWKFRMRPGEEHLDGPPIHGNTRLEVIWTATPAIILVALCSYSYVVLTDIEKPKKGEMRVDVTGQQYAWTFSYPQPGGAPPVKSDALYLPKDKPVRFFLHSQDVIHDFWVPDFRMKVDAVPGITTNYRVTPSRLGAYPVVCAELCGLGHAFMRNTAHVVTPAIFQAWMAKQKAPSQATGGTKVDGKKLFTDGNGDAIACGACHTLADAKTTGTTGPDLDKVLPGQTLAQIREDIVKPNAQIAKGYQAGIMPPNFGDTLSPQELDAVVQYLEKVAGK